MESKRKMEIRLMGFGDERVCMLLKQVVQSQWTWLGWDGVRRRREVPQISEGEGKDVNGGCTMYQALMLSFLCVFLLI